MQCRKIYLVSLCFSLSLFLNPALLAQGFWKFINDTELRQSPAERQIIPSNYATVQLNLEDFKNQLQQAPMRFTEQAEQSTVTIQIPMPNGELEHFSILGTGVMHPKLAARYPHIQSWTGVGQEDPTATLRCEISHKGFRAMIRSARQSTVFIDPYAKGETEHYIVYRKKDFQKTELPHLTCQVEPTNPIHALRGITKEKMLQSMQRTASDCRLRTYRLALACTGEYSTFHGGTKNDVMAEYVTAMNRVNGIYETDATITMVLIPNTDDLIYLNANSDPYTNNNGFAMLGQNQTAINNVIGLNNYDIGHVFSTGGGGVASLNSPCTNGRARGVTGLPQPVNDPFYVDYVAHEMGHQFGGNHTQNNSCNRNNSTAIEPGSASTIMGYAGICPPNVQNNSDDHFHAISLDEIDFNVQFGNSSGCPVVTNIDNNAPSVSLENDSYVLPVSTPFALTAMATDQDEDDVLTYCWEQMDTEIASMPPQPTNNGGPAFRSNSPVESPTRYFPNIQAIIDGQTPQWEVLPSVSRNMDFRCTVRDNALAMGCQGEVDVELTFTASAGPFLVLSPNTNVTWQVGESETVTWDVANTDSAPVNCDLVDILLSVDGGLTYPITLATDVTNDGSFDIVVPNNITTTARVQVICSDNVFFDISNQNFEIEAPPIPTFLVNIANTTAAACQADTGRYDLDFTAILNFDEEISLTISNLPNGATAFYSQNPLIAPSVSVLSIANLDNVPAGSYDLTLEASAMSVSRSFDLTLTVFEGISENQTLATPTDGEEQVAQNPTLRWNQVEFANNYVVEIATNPSFEMGTIIETGTTPDTSYQSQNATGELTVYYWRVNPKNPCTDGDFSPIYAFQTKASGCTTYSSDAVPIPIASNGPSFSNTTFDIDDNFVITDANVYLDIQHSWIGDLTVALIAPFGQNVLLFERPGNEACDNNDIQVTFDDQAINTDDDFNNTCEDTPPAISGTFQPIGTLANYNGENSNGPWRLIVQDLEAGDGGNVLQWDLELCREVPTPSIALLSNNVLTVPNGGANNIDQSLLEIEDTNPDGVTYTLLSLPDNGNLTLNGTPLNIGDTFLQIDINGLRVAYEHDASNTQADGFHFGVTNSDGGWLYNQFFEIIILQNTLAAVSELTQSLACFDGNTAAITVTATGGTAPLSYSIDGQNFQDAPLFDNLTAGSYTVTVMDVNGFTLQTNVIDITAPDEIMLNATVTESDISVSASGGTGTLMYSINGTDFQASNSFMDLANDTYTITVMDENACIKTTTAVVFANTLVVSAALVDNISCFSLTDGSIEATVNGGTAPFQYSLDGQNYQDSPVFDNLNAGIYIITVLDNDGFTQMTNEVMVTEPTDITLSTMSNGANLTVNAMGGTGSLMYSINGVDFQSSNEFMGLDNGTYTVTVSDENGCTKETSAIIAVNTLIVNASIISTVSCSGLTDASIEASVGGGTPPFQYSLDGMNFQDSPTFSGLGAGTYTITVVDNENFTQMTAPLTVTSPSPITASATTNGYDITVTASGGTGDLSYQLMGGTFQSANQFFNNSNGVYQITVQDENGCVTTIDAEVNVMAISGQTTVQQMVTCFGFSDGSITVSAMGGVPAYEYSIDGQNFQDSPTFGNLAAGNYSITIRDSGGFAVLTNEVILVNPTAVSVMAMSDDYDITVSGNGGTGSLQYSIDGMNFQNETVFENPGNGTYTVTAIDDNGCTSTTTVELNIAAIEVTTSLQQDISCNDANDGIIVAEATGGIAPYQYAIDGMNFQDSPVFENLPAGDYSITIRDAGGIIIQTNTIVTVSNPPSIDVSASAFGGTITGTATGGTGQLLYSLNGVDFVEGNVFELLQNGNYTLTVQDENGCTATQDVTVNAITGAFFITMPLQCNGASDAVINIQDVTDGFPPYLYSLNGGDFESISIFDNLPPGTYTIIIEDAVGFQYTLPEIVIDDVPALEIETLLDLNNLTVNANGGTPPYAYSIDGGTTFTDENVFEELPNGSFVVVVTDANDCIIEEEILVNDVFDLDNNLLFELSPNPSTGLFVLTMNQATGKELKANIFDMAGKLVFDAIWIKNNQLFEQSINVSNLPEGVYQLVIEDGQEIGVKRLVIIH